MQDYVRPPLRRASRPRSYKGCLTCRSRKVKCNEVKPTCGQCTKLASECIWAKRWKFLNQSAAVRRDNTHISNTDSPAWGTGLRSHSIPARSSPERTTRPETSRRPRRTFNVILTPDSYSPLASRERLVTSAYSGLRDDSAPIVSLSYDPDIVCLQDLGDDSVNSTSPNSSLTTRPDSTPSPTPQNPQSDVNCNISDEQYHLRRFQNVVAKRLIPVNISAQADSPGAPGDVIVSLSKTCQPLRHAVCALSILLLGLEGRSDLLTKSFKHYHIAINACIDNGNNPSESLPPENLLYLHFILLFFDVYCATQSFVPERQVWAMHLDQLARLAYREGPVNEVQAQLLWCALQLDLSSLLAGDADAGPLVRAYRMNETILPFRYRRRSTPAKTDDNVQDAAAYNFCLDTEHIMCHKLADLGELATEIRARVELGFANMSDIQKRVLLFRDQLQVTWQRRVSIFLSLELDKVEPWLAARIKAMFTTCCIQYSTAMLHLDTSMYPGQLRHNHNFQRIDIARHSKQILTLASEMIENDDIAGQSHLVLSIFLAAMVSRDSQDKIISQDLFRALNQAFPHANVSKTQKLLEVIQEHVPADQLGEGGYMDWIALSRRYGIRNISLGIWGVSGDCTQS